LAAYTLAGGLQFGALGLTRLTVLPARFDQRGALGARDVDVGREGVARHLGRQRGGQRPVPDEVALARTQAVELLYVEHAEHVETVALQAARARADAGGALACAALLGTGAGGGQVDARVVLARDEVDHAADRIGAVDGRRAVLEHLDALDGAGRDVVQVDAGVVARRCEVGKAAAVQQDQRGRHADAAQVGAVHAALARGAVGDAGAVRQRRRVGADVAHQLGGRGGAHLVHVFARDYLHRQGRLAVDALDRGTGDFHAVHRGRVGLRLRQGRLRQRTEGRDDGCRQHGGPQGTRNDLGHAMLPLGRDL
jgi:hypothetical protein